VDAVCTFGGGTGRLTQFHLVVVVTASADAFVWFRRGQYWFGGRLRPPDSPDHPGVHVGRDPVSRPRTERPDLMKRLLTAVAASLMLIATLAGPVAADTPGCSKFDAVTADYAHTARPFGQLVSGVAQGGPHGASWLIALEHGMYCN